MYGLIVWYSSTNYGSTMHPTYSSKGGLWYEPNATFIYIGCSGFTCVISLRIRKKED